MAENPFHASKTKDPQPSSNAMSTMPTSTSPSLPLQDPNLKTSYTPMSFEVAPCQEDSKKDKNKKVKKYQDQAPLHLLQDVTLPYPMSYPPPKYDEDTTSTIPFGLTKKFDQTSMPILSKYPCQDQSCVCGMWASSFTHTSTWSLFVDSSRNEH